MANPAPQPAKPARHRTSFLRIIAMLLLTLIILAGIAVLIIWLVIRPKHLIYTVDEGSIHNFNLSKDHLDSTFDFVIRAYNPNSKVSIYYDKIDVQVDYDDQILAYNGVQPFFQPHRSMNRLDVQLKAQSVELFPSVVEDLKLERSSGAVELIVRIKARIRFKVGAWRSSHRTLKIFCSPVLVHFSSSNTYERTFCDAVF
ncbi:uncharacterized protein At1g08160 [Ziziphus jujuba]|uniref:Uncharacterized protein At1g08160 n=2 Tax=Ziziphus jujuba TaxID=326968 RepID=A0A6P3Z920_ZIZJJ|nr:uncharacterized protein At1g08160 [Ziziphus jujuba]KAH7542109.1 hypothetical protein FEM48_Zijuj02G0038300 [Ziziphus jujuba var. spinosa]